MKQPKRNKKNQMLFFTTPVGEALFAALLTPDTKFNADGVYKTHLKMDAEAPEAEQLKEYIDEETEKVFEEKHNKASAKVKKKMRKYYPYELEIDEETGEETGKILFKFKNKAFFVDKKTEQEVSLKPKLFNAQGKEFDEAGITFVGNGSLIQIAGYMKPYLAEKDGETGVSLKMNAVLIKKLSSSNQSAESYGFDVEETDEEEWDSDSKGAEEVPPAGADVEAGDF